MKSILNVGAILAVAALLAVATMGTALAQSPPPKASPEYQGFKGIIASVSPDGASLVLTTKAHGDVTVSLTDQTIYKVPGGKKAILAVFKPGEGAAVLADANSTALYVHLIPGKPPYAQRPGTVTVGGYIAGTSITLENKKGDLSTFVITADTQVQFKRGATAVQDGSRVVVIAQRDPATNQLTARSILVFGSEGPPPGCPNGPPPGKGPS